MDRKRKGQSLVEFALLLMMFVTLVIGVLEFGTFFFFLSSLNTASRQGVRYGIAANHLNYCQGIADAAQSKLTDLISPDSIEIIYKVDGANYNCPAPGGNTIGTGDQLTVSVTSTYEALFPLFSFLNGTYTADATRSIVVELPIQ